MSRAVRPEPVRERPPRILVIGVCGGVGTSLAAGGLALALADERQGEGPGVALIDLDHGHGDLAAAWGIDDARPVDDLAAVADELDGEQVARAARRHHSGIHLLAAGGRPGVAWPRQRAHRARALAAAGQRAAVVADGGRGGVDLRALAAAATSVVLICPGTVAGARRASHLAALLVEADLDERCALALARGPLRRPPLSGRALGGAVGMNVLAELPWSPAEAELLGGGTRPAGRRRALWEGLRELARVLP